MLASILLIAAGVAFGLLIVTLYAACVVSGRYSREEERQELERINKQQRTCPKSFLGVNARTAYQNVRDVAMFDQRRYWFTWFDSTKRLWLTPK